MIAIDADTTGRVEALFTAAPAGAAELDRQTHAAAKAKARLARTRKRDHASIPPGARRALVVDDDVWFLRAVRRSLVDIVEFVDVAPTVREAHIKLRELAYDVMIADYRLTNGTAADLIRGARRESRRPLIYTILISSLLSPHVGDDIARDVAANDWLRKPVNSRDPEFMGPFLMTLQDRVHKAFAGQPRMRRLK